MRVSDLLTPHPDYNPVLTARISAYYSGGERFPIAQELRHKPIETSSAEAAQPMRQQRIATAFYTNYFGDTILDMVSQTCSEQLQIVDESRRPYWQQLNENADGHYCGATAQARASIADDMLFNRAFYLVKFPENDSATYQDQMASGALDARICALPAQKVTDWKEDDGYGLEWARTYEVESVRSNPFGPVNEELHRWTYFSATEISVYEARKPVGKEWPKDAEAVLVSDTIHELGVCPVFMTRRKLKVWIGDKLLPTARQLFNAESDASFYTFVTVTGGLFIFTDNPAKYKEGIDLSPFGAVICGGGDKIDRDRADPSTLNALDGATAKLRSQLGGMIHTLARQAAAQSASGQNTSRMSGKAVSTQSDPLKQFLLAFAEPQLAVWRRMIAAIGRIREEDVSSVTVQGLLTAETDEDADDPVTTEQMAAEGAFQALPNVPDIAKRQRGKTIALLANEDAPADVIKAINSENVFATPAAVDVPKVPEETEI